MYPVRRAATVSVLALAFLWLAAPSAPAQGEPPTAAPGDPAPPNPLPPGMPTGQVSPDLQIPDAAPPREKDPAPPPATVPDPLANVGTAPQPPPPPVVQERPKAPALPPAFRLLTEGPPHVVPAPQQPFVTGGPPAVVPTLPPAPTASSGAPFLVVEKRGPPSVKLGQPLIYDLVVRNTGGAAAVQVHLQDDIPAGTKLVNTIPTAVVQGTHLVWLMDVLPRGAEARFRVELQPLTPGTISSRASLILFSEESRTTILGTGLALSVAGPDTVAVGQAIVFKIQIVNQQPLPMRGLKLVSRLPDGLQHPIGNEIEADLGDVEANGTKTVELKVNAVQTGRFVPEMFVTVDGNVQASSQAALVVLSAANDATAPVPPPAPVPDSGSGSQATDHPEKSLVVRKKGQQRLVQGQQTEYSLEVVNKGEIDATNVVLQDKLPVGLDFVAASKGVTYDANTRTIVWAAGLLTPHQSSTSWVKLVPRYTGELINYVTVQAEGRPEARLTATLYVSGRFPVNFGLPGFGKQRAP